MTAIVAESALKLSVVVSAALLGTWVLQKNAAATRHSLLAAAVVIAVAMPLLQRVVPAWGSPIAWSWIDARSDQKAASAVAASGNASRAQSGSNRVASAQDPFERTDAMTAVTTIWLTGVALALLPLVVGIIRLMRLTAAAEPVTDGSWSEHASVMLQRAGLRRGVTVKRTGDRRQLFVWGLFRPVVVVPAESSHWSGERVRIVLAHEIAHLARHDWPLQMAAEVLRAVYWFNPLVWLLARRLRAESERACDDAVLAAGVGNTEYATELLAIATELVDRQARWLPAPAMARASHLEGRVAAMLNPNLNRTPLSRSRRAASFVTASVIALAVSGYAISAQTFSSLAGSISDQLGGLLPGATLVLVHQPTGNKYEVKSNRVGLFEFVGLPAGEYSLEANVPGFKTTHSTLLIGGQNIRRDLTLELGTLEETITVSGRKSLASIDGAATAEPLLADMRRLRAMLPLRQAEADWQRTHEQVRLRPIAAVAQGQAVPPACGATAPNGIGGSIKVPMKTRNVPPAYPEQAETSGVEGLVELGAVIGANGHISSVRPTAEANSLLAAAAMDAVWQWEFTPTLLNCRAVDVQMNVHVRFVLE